MTETPAPLEGIIVTDQDGAQLVTVTERSPLEVFTTPGLVPALLERIRTAATEGFTPDLATDKGRKEIASRAFRVAKSKTYLDDLGKDEVARLKELPKQVDAARKTLRDGLDAIRDDIRKPLTEWEERRAKLQERLTNIQNLPSTLFRAGAAEIQHGIARLAATDAATFEEFAGEAEAVIRVTAATLEEMREKAQKAEDDAAELRRLQEDEAKRKQQEREEQLRKEGEARAREAAAAPPVPAAAPAPAPAPQTPTDQQAQAPAPQPILESPAAAPVDIPKAVSDVEHRRAFNREALADLHTATLGLIDREDIAKAILTAIVTGKVRHIAITY